VTNMTNISIPISHSSGFGVIMIPTGPRYIQILSEENPRKARSNTMENLLQYPFHDPVIIE